MKGKRVLLHAGFAKTGTTAIQTAMARHRQDLARLGILYPECRLTGLGHRDSHPALSFAHLRRQFNYRRVVDPREARAWLDDVLSSYADSRNELLILSHETLGEAARRIRWRKLREALHPFEVSSVVYLRVLDEFIESRLEQSLRSGFHATRRMRRQAEHLRPSGFSYLARLARIERGLRCPVRVLSFDTVRQSDQLLESFASAAGIDGRFRFNEASVQQKRRNVSIAGAHRLFLVHASSSRLSDVLRHELIHIFRWRAPALPESLVNRRFGLLAPRLKQRARLLFNQEVPQINRRFGGDIEPARDLEPSDLDYATRLTPAEYDMIVDTLADLVPVDSLALVRGAYGP